MNDICLLFPGQGSQSVGMGFDLAKRFQDFEHIYSETLREADAALGYSLSSVIKDGPAGKLKETQITQPALLTVSTAMGRWLKSKGINAQSALGHSLGEYSALVYANTFDFQTAIQLVELRGKLMQSAIPSGQGGMLALVGAETTKAESLCQWVREQSGKTIEISAYNCPGQIVLSGHIEAIDAAAKVTKDYGVRMAVKLEVSGPFHCSLLRDAGVKLGLALQGIRCDSPSIDVVSNTTGLPERLPEEIRKNLTEQVYRPVLWEQSIQYVLSQSKPRFIEVGSGKVLSGMMKKIAPEAACLALDGIQTWDEASQFIGS